MRERHIFDFPYVGVGLLKFQNEVVGFYNDFQIVFTKEVPLDFLLFLLKNEKTRQVQVLYGDDGFKRLIKSLRRYFLGKLDFEELKKDFYFVDGLYTSDEVLEALWKFWFFSKESLEKWKEVKHKIKN